MKLRRFYISESNQSLFILGIRKLSSLRTLPHFVVSRDIRSSQIEELQDLLNVEGHLKIFGLENVCGTIGKP